MSWVVLFFDNSSELTDLVYKKTIISLASVRQLRTDYILRKRGDNSKAFSIFYTHKRNLGKLGIYGKVLRTVTIPNSNYSYVLIEFSDYAKYSTFACACRNFVLEERYYSTEEWAFRYWDTMILPFIDSIS